MTYPQQYPPQPQPQQPYYPPQAQPYYPPQQPAYQPPSPVYHLPEQQYHAAPQAPVARGTIDDFYSQPVGSGKSLTFEGKPVGFTYAGVVSRTITSADIQPQTNIRNRSEVLRHPDGRVKYVMVVPLQMQPSAEFPDGRAAWYVKGADRTELEAAMERAGCKPGTPPEMGAVITIRYTGERPIPGLNPQKMKQVTYQRPAGAGVAPAEAASPLQQPIPSPQSDPAQQMVNGAYASVGIQPPVNGGQPYPAPQPDPAAYQQAPVQPQFQAPQYGQPNADWNPMAQQAPLAPQYAAAPPQPDPAAYQQAPQAPVMGQVPDLNADQQALLARLTQQ